MHVCKSCAAHNTEVRVAPDGTLLCDDCYSGEAPANAPSWSSLKEIATMEVYVFFREGGFYPFECRDDEAAREQAEGNPGTMKVETATGRVVWIAPKPHELVPN